MLLFGKAVGKAVEKVVESVVNSNFNLSFDDKSAIVSFVTKVGDFQTMVLVIETVLDKKHSIKECGMDESGNTFLREVQDKKAKKRFKGEATSSTKKIKQAELEKLMQSIKKHMSDKASFSEGAMKFFSAILGSIGWADAITLATSGSKVVSKCF